MSALREHQAMLRAAEVETVLTIFVQQAPYFTEDDWNALPPEWRIAWDAVRDLLVSRLRLRGERILPARLSNVGPVAVILLLWAIGTYVPEKNPS